MAQYAIVVREVLTRTVVVNAENQEEALQRVETAVSNSDIILDADDYDYRKISPVPYWPEGKVPDGENVNFYTKLATA